MVEHIKGPWHQYDNDLRYGEGYAATVWGPKGPGHGLIADCRQSSYSVDEQIANAKLCAAAPILLEACKFVRAHECTESPCLECQEKIKQAIKVAEIGNQ